MENEIKETSNEVNFDNNNYKLVVNSDNPQIEIANGPNIKDNLIINEKMTFEILMRIRDLETISSFSLCCKSFNQFSNHPSIWALNLFPNILKMRIINFDPKNKEIEWKEYFKKIYSSHYKMLPKNKEGTKMFKVGDLYKVFQNLIVKGHLEMNIHEALQLAVFQSRIKYGSFTKQEHKIDYTKFLPSCFLKDSHKFEREFYREWKSLKEEKNTNYYYYFFQYVWGLSSCGGKHFYVTEISEKNIFRRNTIQLVITRESILRINIDKKRLIKLNNFLTLKQWRVLEAKKQISFDFCDEMNHFVVFCQFPDLINNYIWTQIKNFKKFFDTDKNSEKVNKPTQISENDKKVYEELFDKKFAMKPFSEFSISDLEVMLSRYKELCVLDDPKIRRLISVRKFGTNHFDTLSLTDLNYETLCHELVRFYLGISAVEASSKIKQILLLPDVLVADDEDVLCLEDNYKLEVDFY